MNQESYRQEMEQTPFYKKTYVFVGYSIPIWLILIVILVILYFLYTNYYKPNTVVNLSGGYFNDMAAASAIETPTVVRNILH